ncbi:MAG: hypothetical protein MRK01_14230 [Candidatus Scalindua sp.]|nr:hypothetical protein [Candidatus Scalindua sp.]
MNFETFTIPKNNKEIFMKPAYEEIAGLIYLNKRGFQSYCFNINGRPYSQFREWVRRETFKKAREYTERMWSLCTNLKIAGDRDFFYRNAAYTPESTIIQTGHAPILTHPGILIKYGLVNNLAKQGNGIGLNLIVDSEICRDPFFSIPHLNGLRSSLEKIPFMTKPDDLPFEEIRYTDLVQLKELRRLVTLYTHNAEMKHTFSEFMDIIMKLHNETENFRDLLTFSRHVYMRRFTIDNLEVPVSHIAETEPFYEFFLHIAQNMKTFADIYNTTLDWYRKEKKIRSKANPLPNLERQGDIIELPFWIWGKNRPRERLFASSGKESHMGLMYRKEIIAELDFTVSGNLSENLKKLVRIKDAGLNIRPRAIINTLYARMFISDLFVHGIGGAKYDLITDEIIKRFYGVEPPSFATISATLHLPFEQYRVTLKDVEGVRDTIKDMNYHPENYTTSEIMRDSSMLSMIREKEMLIMTQIRNQDEKRRVFSRLKELNLLMKEKISTLVREKEKELLSLEKKLRYNSIVSMRDYPFCIYPETLLRELFSL